MNLAGIDKHDIMFFELIAAALYAVGYSVLQGNLLTNGTRELPTLRIPCPAPTFVI